MLLIKSKNGEYRMTADSIIIKSAWEEEYKKKGIPSSFRKDPTKPVIEFVSWLKEKNNLVGDIAADIGCGLGRNSFYLASQGFKVTSIDLVEENVRVINTEAKKNHLPIRAYGLDASTTWPMILDSLDVVIDVFCYKHIVDKEKQSKYRYELSRTLKKEGFYFISLASKSDGFYGPLLKDAANQDENLIVDPYSKIPSFLYSTEELIEEFSDFFDVVEIREQTSLSPMHGKEYSRNVINAIFKKKH
jgi:SAM-dependent methyltransferase